MKPNAELAGLPVNDERALILKVFINSVVTTRVRHVLCDKPLFACRAHPQRPFLLLE
jgi:hypothetical protein